MKIYSAKGRIRCSERCLPRRTSIVSSTLDTMTFAVGILHLSSLVGKSCKQILSGHLYKEMHIFGASRVMLVSKQDLEGSPMALNNLSLHMDHLRNGALMPLGPCLGLQEGKNTSLYVWTT